MSQYRQSILRQYLIKVTLPSFETCLTFVAASSSFALDIISPIRIYAAAIAICIAAITGPLYEITACVLASGTDESLRTLLKASQDTVIVLILHSFTLKVSGCFVLIKSVNL